MQYTADELKGAGTLIKNQLLAGGDYTFYLYRPKNTTGQSPNLSGSGYFTFETVRDANGFYPITTSKLASGSKVNVSGSNTLIESPYIFSYELNTNSNTPQTSSFVFTPEIDVPVSGVFFRATGDYDMEVSPETEACDIQQNFIQGTQNYPTQLQSVLGSTTGIVTLTPTPFSIPDRWIIRWDGNQVIDTGYISSNPTSYNIVLPISSQRAILTSSLEGKPIPELPGEFYPQFVGVGGGTSPNVILSDGYPQVNLSGSVAYNFSKSESISTADISVYGPLPNTGWRSTLSCPA
tara:strand:+ start:459 stop:1337 length:879 start_codon:yes stop_codon:yes gene_type:complete